MIFLASFSSKKLIEIIFKQNVWTPIKINFLPGAHIFYFSITYPSSRSSNAIILICYCMNIRRHLKEYGRIPFYNIAGKNVEIC